jgi:hypothetical protein
MNLTALISKGSMEPVKPVKNGETLYVLLGEDPLLMTNKVQKIFIAELEELSSKEVSLFIDRETVGNTVESDIAFFITDDLEIAKIHTKGYYIWQEPSYVPAREILH